MFSTSRRFAVTTAIALAALLSACSPADAETGLLGVWATVELESASRPSCHDGWRFRLRKTERGLLINSQFFAAAYEGLEETDSGWHLWGLYGTPDLRIERLSQDLIRVEFDVKELGKFTDPPDGKRFENSTAFKQGVPFGRCPEGTPIS